MKRYLPLLLLPLLGLVACSSNQESPVSGYGYVEVACTASDELLVRSALTRAVPAPEEFSLSITDGADFTRSWARFTDFVPADNVLATGLYTACVACGDPEAEGFGKASYAGSVAFEIVSDQTTQAQIVARLTNAQVEVSCTDRFRGYFPEAHFTLTTAAGGSFSLTADTREPVFVRPEAGFSLSGSAIKQNGTQVDLGRQKVENTAPRTLYTYTFDVTGAGSATISISLDDTLIDEIPIVEELNPNA